MRILYTLLLCYIAQFCQAQCSASFTPLGPTTFCQGGSVTFVATQGDVYKWFKDGNYFALLTTDTFTATTGGWYYVVIDDGGCIDTSYTLAVTVNTPPAQPGPITSNDTLCCTSLQSFSVGYVSLATSYTWFHPGWGSGQSTTTSPSLGLQVGTSGSSVSPEYTISVRANNVCGSGPLRTKTVNVYCAPLNWINNDPDFADTSSPSICPGAPFILKAYAATSGGYEGPRDFKWYRNNVYVGGSYYHHNNKGGNYKVEISTGDGHCLTTINKQPIYQLTPTVTITDLSPVGLCPGGVAILKANFDSAHYNGTPYSWTWRKNTSLMYDSIPLLFVTTAPQFTADSYDIAVRAYETSWFSCGYTRKTGVFINYYPLEDFEFLQLSQNGNVLTADSGFSNYRWCRGREFIPGATTNVFSITGPGEYYAVANDKNGCLLKSNSVLEVNVLPENRSPLILYPNPTTGLFTLSADIGASRSATITITDMTGRTVQKRQVNAPNSIVEEKIELDNTIPPGLYLLKLNTENYSKVISFVKQ